MKQTAATPLRRRADGSLDADFYLAAGRCARSRDAIRMASRLEGSAEHGLGRLVHAVTALFAASPRAS